MSFISFEESCALLEQLSIEPIGSVQIPLSSALGRILAEDIVAFEDMPSCPTSALDGYAIRVEDQKAKKIPIDLMDNPAGKSSRVLERGFCIKTFTGAIMPQGSDALIPIENVSIESNHIVIHSEVSRGFGVREVGEIYSKDEPLIRKGVELTYAELGVIATLGMSAVRVALPPRVSILATGSELIDLAHSRSTQSQIYSSNSYMLEALVKSVGADAIQLGVCSDNKQSITSMFERALSCSDIVISSGGVSVGDYDFVKDIVPSLGAKVLFKGVKIKPGQHILVAQRGKKLIFALPGFAYSSAVTAILYILPTIKKMLGDSQAPSYTEAILTDSFTKHSEKTEFVACRLTEDNAQLLVDFDNKKSGTSAVLTNLLDRSAFMVATKSYKSGDRVKVLRV